MCLHDEEKKRIVMIYSSRDYTSFVVGEDDLWEIWSANFEKITFQTCLCRCVDEDFIGGSGYHRSLMRLFSSDLTLSGRLWLC